VRRRATSADAADACMIFMILGSVSGGSLAPQPCHVTPAVKDHCSAT
jgi:hypothetical protein